MKQAAFKKPSGRGFVPTELLMSERRRIEKKLKEQDLSNDEASDLEDRLREITSQLKPSKFV